MLSNDKLRLVALLSLVAAAATIRASPPLDLILAEIPNCSRSQIGQPCPGNPNSECLDLGPDMEPRCVSRCKVAADCGEHYDCLPLGQTGPMRCVPKGFVIPKKGC